MMATCYFHKATRSVADLVVINGELYLLTRVNVPHIHRGVGLGSRILDEVCKDADKHGVTLQLEVVPSGGLNFHQLTRWYEKRGFQSDERKFGMLMMRLPNAASSSEPDREIERTGFANHIRGLSSLSPERAVQGRDL